jgi:hypothetical protein
MSSEFRHRLGKVAERGHLLMGAAFTWFAYLLTSPCDPLYLLSGVICMPLWLYWSHRLLHWIPRDSLFLNPVFHIWGHHGVPKPISNRTLELFAETAWEGFFWIIVPIWLQWITRIHVIPTSIVLLSSLMWISIHVIQYSIVGSETHSRHHRDTRVNYGPDILDHLFGTNYDETHEDTTYAVLHAIGAACVVLCLKYSLQYAE